MLLLQVVAPKRIALGEANKKLEGATKKLVGIRARVKELQDKVAALEDNLMKVVHLFRPIFRHKPDHGLSSSGFRASLLLRDPQLALSKLLCPTTNWQKLCAAAVHI